MHIASWFGSQYILYMAAEGGLTVYNNDIVIVFHLLRRLYHVLTILALGQSVHIGRATYP